MKLFWMTVSLPAHDESQAEKIAKAIAKRCNGRVLQVQQEPPQGSTIVGDFWEHEDDARAV